VVDDAAGVLYAVDPAIGKPRGRIGIGATPHFASPTLAGNRAYVGTLSGIVAINGA
jgi:polyvinyl alcohol dehydrogenase (cytochrome)